MDEQVLKLPNAPIVEAVIDIDCDMPPTLDIKELEKPARDQFRDTYPKFQLKMLREHKFVTKADAPPQTSIRQEIQAIQFLNEDEKQLVQIRSQGFSFNRLKPYSSLDEYVPEIQRTWEMFLKLASPVQIRSIRLRYINRILLPLDRGKVDLQDYLKIGPRLPDETRLSFSGFLNQHSAVEEETGNDVNIVLASQAQENEDLPIIFDITVAKTETMAPPSWTSIISRIQSLRKLKNRIFRDTLTEQCLELFQ